MQASQAFQGSIHRGQEGQGSLAAVLLIASMLLEGQQLGRGGQPAPPVLHEVRGKLPPAHPPCQLLPHLMHPHQQPLLAVDD